MGFLIIYTESKMLKVTVRHHQLCGLPLPGLASAGCVHGPAAAFHAQSLLMREALQISPSLKSCLDASLIQYHSARYGFKQERLGRRQIDVFDSTGSCSLCIIFSYVSSIRHCNPCSSQPLLTVTTSQWLLGNQPVTPLRFHTTNRFSIPEQ